MTLALVRLGLAAGVAGAALALPTATSAASSTYGITGLEIAATSTQGTFVGTGTGETGDRLAWKAVVQHSQLSLDPSAPAVITGGALTGATYGGGSLDTLAGAFTGGTVTYDVTRSSSTPCGTQVFDVDGNLALASGPGSFQATLTHYRLDLIGHCVTVGASVTGTLKLSGSNP